MSPDASARAAPYWLTGPALAVFLALVIIPLGMTVLLAFYDWGQYKGIVAELLPPVRCRPVGLRNVSQRLGGGDRIGRARLEHRSQSAHVGAAGQGGGQKNGEKGGAGQIKSTFAIHCLPWQILMD